MSDRENIDRHIFAWFNERYPEEMRQCLVAWDNNQPDNPFEADDDLDAPLTLLGAVATVPPHARNR